jgi:hypothetical protein
MNPNFSACLLAFAQASGDSSDLPDLHGSLLSSLLARIISKMVQQKPNLSIDGAVIGDAVIKTPPLLFK